MKNILQENMHRFGTKNLPSLLTEGIKWHKQYYGPIDLGLDGKTAKLYADEAETKLLFTVQFYKDRESGYYDQVTKKQLPPVMSDGRLRHYQGIEHSGFGPEVLWAHFKVIGVRGNQPKNSVTDGVVLTIDEEQIYLTTGIEAHSDTEVWRTNYTYVHNKALLDILLKKREEWIAANPETPETPPPAPKPAPSKTDFR